MIGDQFLHFEVKSFYIHDIEANLNFINLNFINLNVILLVMKWNI